MFDMTKTGKTISRLRKENNITQMELADKLGISFQAVSNWERGNTMPDISKLPELAQILGTSVDELLGSSSSARIIENAAKDTHSLEEATPSEIADIAPLLKPEQLTEYVNSANEAGSQGDTDNGFSLEWLVSMAPFLDEDVLRDCVNKFIENGGSMKELVALAPFLDEDDLGRIADKAMSAGGSIEDIISLAPFLDEDYLGRIAKKSIKSDDFSKLPGLAPFLDEDDLSDIVKEYLKSGGSPKDIMGLMPFLEDDALNNIFRQGFKKRFF